MNFLLTCKDVVAVIATKPLDLVFLDYLIKCAVCAAIRICDCNLGVLIFNLLNFDVYFSSNFLWMIV